MYLSWKKKERGRDTPQNKTKLNPYQRKNPPEIAVSEGIN